MESRGLDITATIVTFLTLGWLSVLARCLVRVFYTRRFFADDWLLLLSLIFCTTTGALVITAVYWGFGRHSDDPDVRSKKSAIEAFFYAEIFYLIASTFLRVTAGEQIMRHITRNSHRWMIYICNAINVLFNIYLIFASIFRCKPVSHFWTVFDVRGKPPGKCDLMIALRSTYFQSGISAAIDITFSTLPWWALIEQVMPKKEKIGLGVVLAMSYLSGIAMIIRLPALVNTSSFKDFMWISADVVIWSQIECGIGLLTLALAPLGPLLPTFRRNQRNGNYYNREYDSASRLRGIPLGNNTYIEGGQQKKKGLFASKSKQKALYSTENLVRSPERSLNGKLPETFAMDDLGILKTTDVMTYSAEDLGRVAQKAPGPLL